MSIDEDAVNWHVAFDDDVALHHVTISLGNFNLIRGNTLLSFVWPQDARCEEFRVSVFNTGLPSGSSPVEQHQFVLRVATIRDVLQTMARDDKQAVIQLSFKQAGVVAAVFADAQICAFRIQLQSIPADAHITFALPRPSWIVQKVAHIASCIGGESGRFKMGLWSSTSANIARGGDINTNNGTVVYDVKKSHAKSLPMITVIYRRPLVIARIRLVAAIVSIGLSLIARKIWDTCCQGQKP